ncbi:MAG TPA: hypothetical protein VGZ29_07510 [Terriglobia bacterium]|nr:hypothetical protein [Terriglobia bacterium]
MRTRSCLFAVAFMVAVSVPPAAAGDREFHQIVDRLSAAYQKKPMPFMGLVSFAARFAQPEGVSGLKMAIFDGVDPALRPDPADFDAFVQRVAGPDYRPMVRVRSNRDGEQTYIYVRAAKSGYEMLLLTLETSDAVVMKMHLNPSAMEAWVDDPVDHGKNWSHGDRQQYGVGF